MSLLTNESINLIFPHGIEMKGVRLTEQDFNELELNAIIHMIDNNRKHFNDIRNIFRQLSYDPETIKFRLDIIEDLLNNFELLLCLEESLSIIDDMRFVSGKYSSVSVDMLQTVSRLKELGIYVDFVKQLRKAFTEKAHLKSEGLIRLRDRIIQISEDFDFKNLSEQLPKLQKGLDSISSVTIGINFDAQLNPVEAILVSINDKRFSGNSLLGKLFASGNEYQGVSELYKNPEHVETVHISKNDTSTYDMSPEETELRRLLFRDLKKVLKNVLKPIQPMVERYSYLHFNWILSLETDIAFYVGAVKFIHKLRDWGMPMCRPTLLPSDERKAHLKGNYNLNLALRMSTRYEDGKFGDHIVTNDVIFNDHGRIFILTGPNSGGKTTYAQAIGLTQVLMQAGLYVPCVEAEISPVDGLYPYFNVEENSNMETGRLGVESKKIGEIFQNATPNSLILLNESFSSTSPGESFYLMKDIVCALKLLGLRAVIATHLHELAESINEINSQQAGESKLISMVAGIKEEIEHKLTESNRSYKVTPGKPQGQSFARDIAQQYGISLKQLTQTIHERNLVTIPSE
ncbi:hypothetical protein MNQ98_21220 [Paenibacillus sp. N3/727]|uniref:MutS-related protein n=1 Tax=Paenibacillus sp. N3/727 TaxID=2925845 RepID=UPI001F52CA30|nr:hypothetical protein [Paenibacillus sp. N3/727]UNK16990.1 hypothetical protein MNQ98_21220 [Paenibacillus sp. N3/727]